MRLPSNDGVRGIGIHILTLYGVLAGIGESLLCDVFIFCVITINRGVTCEI